MFQDLGRGCAHNSRRRMTEVTSTLFYARVGMFSGIKNAPTWPGTCGTTEGKPLGSHSVDCEGYAPPEIRGSTRSSARVSLVQNSAAWERKVGLNPGRRDPDAAPPGRVRCTSHPQGLLAVGLTGQLVQHRP
jgi:hypothetical protein